MHESHAPCKCLLPLWLLRASCGVRIRPMTVVVANTLTGEFSRPNLLRYRWPFVERRLRAAAGSRWPGGELDALVCDF